MLGTAAAAAAAAAVVAGSEGAHFFLDILHDILAHPVLLIAQVCGHHLLGRLAKALREVHHHRMLLRDAARVLGHDRRHIKRFVRCSRRHSHNDDIDSTGAAEHDALERRLRSGARATGLPCAARKAWTRPRDRANSLWSGGWKERTSTRGAFERIAARAHG